jgi:hypothetical protein
MAALDTTSGARDSNEGKFVAGAIAMMLTGAGEFLITSIIAPTPSMYTLPVYLSRTRTVNSTASDPSPNTTATHDVKLVSAAQAYSGVYVLLSFATPTPMGMSVRPNRLKYFATTCARAIVSPVAVT